MTRGQENHPAPVLQDNPDWKLVVKDEIVGVQRQEWQTESLVSVRYGQPLFRAT